MYWKHACHYVENGMNHQIFVLVLCNNKLLNSMILSVTLLSTDEWLMLRNL